MRQILSSLLNPVSVTLMIDGEAARLMTVQHNKVLGWGSAPIPRNAIVDGQVASVDTLAASLERLIETQKPPTTRVLVGLSGVGTRTAMVPLAGPDDPLPEEVAVMVQRLGFVPADYHTATQAVGRPGQRALFVLAMARPVLEGYLTALEQAGLAPIAVDVKPLCLIRAVSHRYAIIADLERTLLTVIIVDEALPRLVRLIPLRAPLLSRPEDKATRLIETLAGAIREYNQGADGNYLHPAVPIHLSGALADHPLLKDAIQMGLGHPPSHPRTPFTGPSDLPLTQYLGNVGLALKKV